MTKHEAPPLRMIVEKGRLVPSSQWDQERILSYRNGSTVHVHVTQEKNRKLERKYWAILGAVVRSCGVKQRTAEDLHKAIRFKLGIVDAYWSFGDKLRVEVRSTTSMDDPEYSLFFEDAMELLRRETGVDPETLGKESADTGDEEQNSLPDRLQPEMEEAATEAAAAEDGGESADGPPSFTSSDSASGPPPPTAEQPEPSSFPSPLDGSGDINRAWLAEVFRVLLAAVGEDPGVVDRQVAAFADSAREQNEATRGKAKAIKESLKRGCGNDPKRLEAEIDYCAGLIGVDRKTLIAQAEAGGV